MPCRRASPGEADRSGTPGLVVRPNLYSLVSCARVNGLEPYAYLLHLLEWLPTAVTTEALEGLLPWNVKPVLKIQRVAA